MIRLIFVSVFVMGLDIEVASAVSTSVIRENNKGVEYFKDWLQLIEEKQRKMQQKQQEEAAKNPDKRTQQQQPQKFELSPDDMELLYMAKEVFLKAVVEEPLNGGLHLNYGVTLELTKDEEKSLKEYLTVIPLSKESSFERFLAYVNAARIYAKKKEINKALEYYQKALSINPDSKEVKTNIELLWQNQQGEGKGEGDQSGEEGQDGDDKKDKNQNDDGKNPKDKPQPKPKEFKSKELSKEDVRRILEEIKNQEQKIREKVNQKSLKERPRDKDW